MESTGEAGARGTSVVGERVMASVLDFVGPSFLLPGHTVSTKGHGHKDSRMTVDVPLALLQINVASFKNEGGSTELEEPSDRGAVSCEL